jgi:cobalt/nickel transport system ATP-binding protein
VSSQSNISRLFSLDDVRFAYDGGPDVLSRLNLEIAAGEFLLLLGANGSGKTTVLKLLDGLLFPRGGSVAFRGEPLTEARLAQPEFNRYFRRQVGLLFQNPEIQLFCPTVAEDVAFGPSQLGLSPESTAERVRDALDLLGISGLAQRSVLSLSDGEKQRVALAGVLALSPEVLLMDEPFASLDASAASSLLGLLARLHEMGKTIVVATHEPGRFADFAARALNLSADDSLLPSHRVSGR